jgi:hypothetical protein
MATINWPTNIRIGGADYGIEFDVQISVMRNGRVYTYGLPGGRWTASLRFEADFEDMTRPQIEALIVSLEGGAHRLSMPHFGRPTPNGTLRGSPTIAGTLLAGSKTINITSANGTLKAGDIIGVPGQIVMVTQDVAPFATNLTAQVRPAIRSQHNSGTPIAWNRPTTLWIPRASTAGPFPFMPGGARPGFSIDLVEA